VLSNYLDNLGRNNIGNQGMILLMEKQLPLNQLGVSNYLLYSDSNNITVEGLRPMPNSNSIQLKQLDLGNNIYLFRLKQYWQQWY
jgi:hypothetical protein